MRAFYNAYRKVPQLVGQLENLPIFSVPWGHNVLIIERVQPTEARLWYVRKTIDEGWSRNSLEDCIKSDVYGRKGKAITNFKEKLPAPQSRLADELLKDPYNFDFLSLTDGYREQELEQGLVEHVEKFLIELGQGFAFMGRQYPLSVDGDTYYLDLLFYLNAP